MRAKVIVEFDFTPHPGVEIKSIAIANFVGGALLAFDEASQESAHSRVFCLGKSIKTTVKEIKK